MTAAVAPLPKRQNEPNWSQLFQKEEREREKKRYSIPRLKIKNFKSERRTCKFSALFSSILCQNFGL